MSKNSSGSDELDLHPGPFLFLSQEKMCGPRYITSKLWKKTGIFHLVPCILFGHLFFHHGFERAPVIYNTKKKISSLVFALNALLNIELNLIFFTLNRLKVSNYLIKVYSIVVENGHCYRKTSSVRLSYSFFPCDFDALDFSFQFSKLIEKKPVPPLEKFHCMDHT